MKRDERKSWNASNLRDKDVDLLLSPQRDHCDSILDEGKLKEWAKLVLVMAASLGFIYAATQILGYYEKRMIDDAIVKALNQRAANPR